MNKATLVDTIKQALPGIARESLTPEGLAGMDVFDREEIALGLVLAKVTHFDGGAVLRIAAHALEDANFHTEAETLRKLAAAS